ncbi:MAG: class II glutamine amidotransferase [Nitrosopumilus sp.]|nr:class II glutamine amidotransferase [Nitrosopumilus sp.]
MCGICGIMMDDADIRYSHVGSLLQDMMESQQIRAQDGAGIAIFDNSNSSNSFRIKSFRANGEKFTSDEINSSTDKINENLISLYDDADCTFYSLENKMMLIKDVGLAKDLDKKYNIRQITGSHGIGHLRIATSSRVTPYNTHPFSTTILPDVAIVHNGEITNYNMLRDMLELEGYSFYTDSDSEVIAVFIASQILKHGDVERAHREFISRADGPFTYIAATADSLAIVRDKFGTRKGIIGYNPGTEKQPPFWAMATDLSALDVIGATEKIETPHPGKPKIFYRN